MSGSVRFVEKLSKKMMALINKRYSPQFWIDSDLLYLKLGQKIFSWMIELDGLTYQNEIPIKTYSNHPFRVKDGHFIFYDVYNQEDEDDAFLSYYDPYRQETTSYFSFDFVFPQYTYIQPLHYISVLENHFLFSQGISYQIDLYDSSGAQTHTIQLNDSVHFPVLKKKEYEKYLSLTRIYENPKDYIPEIQTLLTKGSRIWSVNFITYSAIMVRYSKPTEDHRFEFVDDIWRLKDDDWVLDYSVVHNERAKLTLNRNTIWPFATFNSKYIVSGGKLFYFVFNTSKKLMDIDFQELTTLDRMTHDHLKIYILDFND